MRCMVVMEIDRTWRWSWLTLVRWSEVSTLVLQIVETGVPVVVALNMIDEASAAGADFDISRLAGWFGTTVVPTVASKGKGLDELRDAVAAATRVGSCDDAAWTGFSPHAGARGVDRRAVVGRHRFRRYPDSQAIVGRLVASVPRRRRPVGFWSPHRSSGSGRDGPTPVGRTTAPHRRGDHWRSGTPGLKQSFGMSGRWRGPTLAPGPIGSTTC